jgi:uncharacterized membrane protein
MQVAKPTPRIKEYWRKKTPNEQVSLRKDKVSVRKVNRRGRNIAATAISQAGLRRELQRALEQPWEE